jgi:hypothetical protein
MLRLPRCPRTRRLSHGRRTGGRTRDDQTIASLNHRRSPSLQAERLRALGAAVLAPAPTGGPGRGPDAPTGRIHHTRRSIVTVQAPSANLQIAIGPHRGDRLSDESLRQAVLLQRRHASDHPHTSTATSTSPVWHATSRPSTHCWPLSGRFNSTSDWRAVRSSMPIRLPSTGPCRTCYPTRSAWDRRAPDHRRRRQPAGRGLGGSPRRGSRDRRRGLGPDLRALPPGLRPALAGSGSRAEMARQIVESHPGRLVLAQRSGPGSTFVIWLPERAVAGAPERSLEPPDGDRLGRSAVEALRH